MSWLPWSQAAPTTSRETVIRLLYAPVVDVHWVTVKQLAYLEPTLVEVVACMIGDLLNDALRETIHGYPQSWYCAGAPGDHRAAERVQPRGAGLAVGDTTRPASGYDRRTVAADVCGLLIGDVVGHLAQGAGDLGHAGHRQDAPRAGHGLTEAGTERAGRAP